MMELVFIGVADKCEKTIRLSAADQSVANLINDDKLGFLDILSRKPAARSVSAVSRILIRLVIFSKHTV